MKVTKCSATTQYAVGVALNTVAAEEFCSVCVRGVVKVTAGGAIDRGKTVQTAANAKVIVLADGSASYAAGDIPDRISRAVGITLQTFASGDTGLIYVDKA